MKLEHAKIIKEAADVLGLEMEVRESYSGRSMYGEKTAGVVGDHSDIWSAAIEAAYRIGAYDGGANYDFIFAMREIRFDNMGRQMIAY